MRLRNVKGARERLANHAKVYEEPCKNKGKWHEIFNNTNPIHIEIGMGKGKFIIEHALKYPEINYIGFEKYSSVLARATEKIDEVEVPNLSVVRMDAEMIEDVFEAGEIERIYLNFSDPWPKERHAKRRLTHQGFLEKYERLLKDKGELYFKTDNRPLFEFSLEQFQAKVWQLKNVTYDLHKTKDLEHNIMTEYEEKFVAAGVPICRLEGQPKR